MTEAHSIDPVQYEESPDFRPVVDSTLHNIYDTTNHVELKQFSGANLASLALLHRFNEVEVDVVAAALADQKIRLTAPDEMFHQPDLPETLANSKQADWSPTAILDTIKDRPRDARELAANDR